MPQTILMVDDKREIRELVSAYLGQEGFRVITAGDGQEALYAARHEQPDLIILDLMMPEMGGYEFMRIYGKEADTPIIILTAKVEESERILGLELGADDYIIKPFSPRELAARVRAVLRRVQKQHAAQTVLRAADISLDRETRTVTVGDRRVDLTPSEFDLLAVLMATAGRVYTRSELLDRLQGEAYAGYERTIDVHVRNLRTKIEQDPGKPRYVETVFGVGYRFAPDL
jgi:two-component system, OmpR family, alkaline phosphatase synthesis response regulator PhoP